MALETPHKGGMEKEPARLGSPFLCGRGQGVAWAPHSPCRVWLVTGQGPLAYSSPWRQWLLCTPHRPSLESTCFLKLGWPKQGGVTNQVFDYNKYSFIRQATKTFPSGFNDQSSSGDDTSDEHIETGIP